MDLGLLYKSDTDPHIEKDIKKLELLSSDFEKKYRGKDFVSNSKKLLTALNDYQKLEDNSIAKPWWYFALRNKLNSDDAKASAAASKMQQRMSHANNKITFFVLELGKISPLLQKKYLKDPLLVNYKYLLERIFITSKYTLSEKEEQLAGLLSQTSYSMWVDGNDRLIEQKTVPYKGEEIPLSKANEIYPDLPTKERRALYNSIIETYRENSTFAEAELNAIINYKKVMDERRGYKKSYSATLLANENDEKTIEDLVAIVTKYFHVSKRFYALHAKLLKEKTITRADLMARIGKIDKKFTFEDSIEIVKRAFSQVDKKYADIVEVFASNGQLDVHPKKGKSGGGFCWGMGSLPTFILLNHANTLRSVEVIAHEMGHAIHGELDRNQPIQYKGHSTATAEVASTFFEQLVVEELSKTLSEEEQIILLHSQIQEDIITIFAQIGGFNYEVELHEKIRTEGQLNRGAIAALLRKHYDSYLGKAVITTPEDGYRFVGWMHTRLFFCVYSYAYGKLISRALYEKWKTDHSYAKKIEQFLSAGRSMSPKDIFKSIGINTNEAFFEAGLKGIEADIDKLEKLAKKYKKI